MESEYPAETPELAEEGLPGPLEGVEVKEGETGEISQDGDKDAPEIEEAGLDERRGDERLATASKGDNS